MHVLLEGNANCITTIADSNVQSILILLTGLSYVYEFYLIQPLALTSLKT